MSRYVVDASVALKWYVPEAGSEAARRLYGLDLSAPDLLFPEIGSALRKKMLRGEMEADEAFAVLGAISRSRIEIHACGPLAEYALEISNATGASFYDCTYLSLAAQARLPLVTADDKFYRLIEKTAFVSYMRRVEDVH